MSKDSGQPSVRRVSLPAPISPTYNFASPVTTSQGRAGRKVSVRPGSIFERNVGAEERKLSVVWARHTPGNRVGQKIFYTRERPQVGGIYLALSCVLLA